MGFSTQFSARKGLALLLHHRPVLGAFDPLTCIPPGSLFERRNALAGKLIVSCAAGNRRLPGLDSCLDALAVASH